jgi:hypothetical protein
MVEDTIYDPSWELPQTDREDDNPAASFKDDDK